MSVGRSALAAAEVAVSVDAKKLQHLALLLALLLQTFLPAAETAANPGPKQQRPALGAPACWTTGLTPEECCDFRRYGAQGNPSCWGYDPATKADFNAHVCCQDWGQWTSPKCWNWKNWKDILPRFVGWRVHSQSDQDSVLMLIFSIIGLTNSFYVEFGINDPSNLGSGSNTRMLASSKWRMIPQTVTGEWHQDPKTGTNILPMIVANQRWRGVLFDVDHENVTIGLYRERITPKNVAAVFQRHNTPREPDYVSIDIDSCDLWVFLAMTKHFRPRVITVEYNWFYAFEDAVAMGCRGDGTMLFNASAYERADVWTGASLVAIWEAAVHRGYVVVWVTCGLDVFLVRSDLLCPDTAMTFDEFYELFHSCTGIPPPPDFRVIDGAPMPPTGIINVRNIFDVLDVLT